MKNQFVLLPACYPDVAVIHVPRCDKYGNAQIDGITVEDFELSRAARRVIITTEKIIDNKKIRQEPYKTIIPFYLSRCCCRSSLWFSSMSDAISIFF